MSKVSKVVYAGETLIDLTADTVIASKLAKGYTAHGKDGELITGTNEFDVNSQDANATAEEILLGKTAYARGIKLTGTMPNKGAVNGTISTKSGTFAIAQGYHDGSGRVAIDSTEMSKLIPANIKNGVSILGVMGSLTGDENDRPQQKTVTPSTQQQIITADEGYTFLTQVTVEPIPYQESENSAGGITVTIA